MGTRKDFLTKTCLTGACLCGFPALLQANEVKAVEEQNKETEITRQWISTLLRNVEDISDETLTRRLIKGCAFNHYRQLDMDQLLEPYIGKLNAFFQFLESSWGWKIDYQADKGIIRADENKAYCVCPVLKPCENGKYPALCYCSEGFAELMFSKVCEKPISARIISSIHRGDERCVYEICL